MNRYDVIYWLSKDESMYFSTSSYSECAGKLIKRMYSNLICPLRNSKLSNKDSLGVFKNFLTSTEIYLTIIPRDNAFDYKNCISVYNNLRDYYRCYEKWINEEE